MFNNKDFMNEKGECFMAVVSARIDDEVKKEAEEIAGSIGLSLSSVINIFLNRFIAEEGFPFSVTAPKKEKTTALFDKKELEVIVKKAINQNAISPIQSCYFDPVEQKIKYTE